MSDSAPVTIQELPKRLAEFINSWPLYSPFHVTLPGPTSYTPDLPQTILRDCPNCEATPTWERRHPSASPSSSPEYVGIGGVLAYRCTHCGKAELRVWYVEISTRRKEPDGSVGPILAITLRKLGQWPAQSIEPGREVEKEFKESALDFFKKGLTSLAHGFGLGALAYFRRVVEDATGQVIDLFADTAAADGNTDAETTIRAAKESGRTEDRLKLASEALPEGLRPGGANPLAVLYGHYSRGIHGLSDEQCLEVARELHFTLEYIFKNWRLQMQEAAKFKATVQRWSDSSKTPGEAG